MSTAIVLNQTDLRNVCGGAKGGCIAGSVGLALGAGFGSVKWTAASANPWVIGGVGVAAGIGGALTGIATFCH